MAPQALSPTTLFVSATFAVPTTDALAGVGTATDIATNALPTQLVYDSSAARNPLGPATTSLPPTSEPANSKVQSSPTAATDPNRTASAEPNTSSHNDLPVAAIIMAIIAAGAIAALLFFLWYRKRARRRGHIHSRADSHDMRGPPAGDVLRKLGPATYEKSDPFSDTNAVSVPVDPFADPEKGEARHDRSGSDSFLSMGVPRQPYTHAASASTGSSASSKMRKREMDDEREKDMMALNNLVRALDQKERKAEQEGRDRKSLPPIELFKAALVR